MSSLPSTSHLPVNKYMWLAEHFILSLRPWSPHCTLTEPLLITPPQLGPATIQSVLHV